MMSTFHHKDERSSASIGIFSKGWNPFMQVVSAESSIRSMDSSTHISDGFGFRRQCIIPAHHSKNLTESGYEPICKCDTAVPWYRWIVIPSHSKVFNTDNIVVFDYFCSDFV